MADPKGPTDPNVLDQQINVPPGTSGIDIHIRLNNETGVSTALPNPAPAPAAPNTGATAAAAAASSGTNTGDPNNTSTSPAVIPPGDPANPGIPSGPAPVAAPLAGAAAGTGAQSGNGGGKKAGNGGNGGHKPHHPTKAEVEAAEKLAQAETARKAAEDEARTLRDAETKRLQEAAASSAQKEKDALDRAAVLERENLQLKAAPPTPPLKDEVTKATKRNRNIALLIFILALIAVAVLIYIKRDTISSWFASEKTYTKAELDALTKKVEAESNAKLSDTKAADAETARKAAEAKAAAAEADKQRLADELKAKTEAQADAEAKRKREALEKESNDNIAKAQAAAKLAVTPIRAPNYETEMEVGLPASNTDNHILVALGLSEPTAFTTRSEVRFALLPEPAPPSDIVVNGVRRDPVSVYVRNDGRIGKGEVVVHDDNGLVALRLPISDPKDPRFWEKTQYGWVAWKNEDGSVTKLRGHFKFSSKPISGFSEKAEPPAPAPTVAPAPQSQAPTTAAPMVLSGEFKSVTYEAVPEIQYVYRLERDSNGRYIPAGWDAVKRNTEVHHKVRVSPDVMTDASQKESIEYIDPDDKVQRHEGDRFVVGFDNPETTYQRAGLEVPSNWNPPRNNGWKQADSTTRDQPKKPGQWKWKNID